MTKCHLSLLPLFLLCQGLLAQTVLMDNGLVEMDISLSGGIITRMQLHPLEVNPIHEYGHFICFDRWGPSSKEDKELGIPFHGNGSKVEWTLLQEPQLQDGMLISELSCLLPVVNLGMRRNLSLGMGSSVFRVSEEITNHNSGPKVFNVVQHPTLGRPFLDESTVVDTEVDSGYSQRGPLPPGPDDVIGWPVAVFEGDTADMRYLGADHELQSSVLSYKLNEATDYRWVSAVNPSLKLLVGYLWPSGDYPWLNLWQQKKDGEAFARGLEFGTTGLHKTWPEVLDMDSIFGKRLYHELEAGESLVLRYYAFMAVVPDNYRGVTSVILVNDTILIEEYGSERDRRIALPLQGDVSGMRPYQKEMGQSFQLECFPNPFQSQARITFRLTEEKQVQIRLMNLQGQVVQTLDSELLQAGTHHRTLRAEGMPAGTYICQLSADKQHARQILVLQP
jgi:hypothetical protein